MVGGRKGHRSERRDRRRQGHAGVDIEKQRSQKTSAPLQDCRKCGEHSAEGGAAPLGASGIGRTGKGCWHLPATLSAVDRRQHCSGGMEVSNQPMGAQMWAQGQGPVMDSP